MTVALTTRDASQCRRGRLGQPRHRPGQGPSGRPLRLRQRPAERGAVEADNLVVGLLGGGRITLAGRAKQLKATVQGSGDLAAAGLQRRRRPDRLRHGRHVAVAVARTAKVTATGPGDVEIIGSPTCTVEGEGLRAGSLRQRSRCGDLRR